MGNCGFAKVLFFPIPSLKKAADNAWDVLNEAVSTCVSVLVCLVTSLVSGLR